MPEGDTVWLAARRMDAAFAGTVLTAADLRVPASATTDLTGLTVREVRSRGKHMLTRLEGGATLHTHFRMDGMWRIDRTGTRWRGGPAHQVRIVLENADWRALGLRLHDVALVRTEAEDTLVGHLGPDLLGPDWDSAEAIRRLSADPGRALGEALLDQRNLAGIGNLYQNETAFLSGYTPWTPVGDIADLPALVERVRRLMFANRNHPEQSTTGHLLRGQTHWVYGRARQSCLRCRSSIRIARLGSPPTDRAAFWCARCQKGPAPAVGPADARTPSL